MTRAHVTKRALVAGGLSLGLAAVLATVLAAVPAGSPALAQKADASQARIETFYIALLDSMKNAKTLGVKGRYDKLSPVVLATFDVPSMTKGAVGTAWASIPAAEQATMTNAMARMMVATYASRFDDFTGEKFEILGTAPQGADQLVKTRIIQSNGKAVPINYLMRDGKVVDIHLDGTISELAGRRAEFGSILKSGGANALISSLNAKSDKMMAGS